MNKYILKNGIILDGSEDMKPYKANILVNNGIIEGKNNLIKVIKRIAYGYRNFDFFRLRTMYILNGKVSGITKKDRNTKK